MASATAPGEIKLVAVAPNGQEIEVHRNNTEGPIAAGGSPDGTLANLTADKQLFLPRGGPVLTTGWKVGLRLMLSSADGIDASDCTVHIPLTRDDGSTKIITAADLGFDTDFPASTPADQWLSCGSDYSIPAGTRWKIGGGNVVVAIENDTA